MATSKKSKKPYSERSDIEKIRSNWNKTKGLYKKDEFSGAIVRAATAVEIAANLVIREELEVGRNLEKSFVDNLLLWANGIQGKLERLIIPLSRISKNINISEELISDIKKINKERNLIAHSGQFRNGIIAEKIIGLSKKVVETLVEHYQADFKLKEIK
jgi:hypothetical protein